MLFFLPAQKNILTKLGISILILTPILSSCSSNNNQFVEIITPPTLSDDFSSIPDETEDPKLRELSSADEIIKYLHIGRTDPFLPPNFNKGQLLVPDSFKYLGQIASNNVINAIVTYEDRSGLIKPGDIGGKSTDLLPPDWIFEDLDIHTQVLTLGFDDSYLKLDLFHQN